MFGSLFDLFAVQGWLFNHEGTRRGKDFVTRKISSSIAKIKVQLENNEKLQPLLLGNLNAERDWTDAEDFMRGVWLMLNQNAPKNYILGSGEMHTVREFLNESLKCANIKFSSFGDNDEEKYFNENRDLIFEVDPKFYRPAEVHELCGDCSLAENEMGWTRKTDFYGLVKKMYQNDYTLLYK